MSAVIVTPTARTRYARIRPFLALVAVALAALIGFAILPSSAQSYEPLSIRNTRPFGAQAIARVLEHHGFTVHETDSSRQAIEMINAYKGKEPTLVVLSPEQLPSKSAALLAEAERIVAFGPPFGFDSSLLEGLELAESQVTSGSVDAGPTESETARIAGSISVFGSDAINGDDRWMLAFPVSGSHDSFLFAEYAHNGIYRTVIASPEILENQHIALHGNAALVLNAVTAHTTLPPAERGPIIVLHSTSQDTIEELAPPIPEWAQPVALLIFLSFIAFGLSQGLRVGRFVCEDTPSYVPAAETVSGKGRLLRDHRQVEHIATNLRRETARKLAKRLAVAPGSSKDSLIAALIAAGADPANVAWLWEPIPQSADDLVQINEHLTALEKEIHQ